MEKKTKTYNFILIMLMIALFSACQISPEDSANNETGELSIELTDAKGDFTNYTVDVVSLSLTKKNGSIVETLPETTRIDFSQYVEMSEFLTLATIPRGIYTSATLRLDYQNADIYVEDEAGNSVKVNRIVDENGEAITALSTKVTLAEHKQLVIAPGVPAHLSLDFDLKTSNVVSFDEDVPSIVVSPILNASLEPERDKTHRVRGPLKKVNIEDANFDLIVRPFHHKIKDENERFGKLRISTNDNTHFKIDGNAYVGTEGIEALATLERLTAIIVVGDISFNPRRFTATEVYAGESVPGGSQDSVKGTVLSRSGNTLVVRGATLVRTDGSVFFNDNVSVLIDTTTSVNRQRDELIYTIDDISVGQAVTIFGDLGEDTADLTLDASSGIVRMRMTNIKGTVIDDESITDGDAPFELNLRSINGRQLALFDFAGTGIDAASDANPAAYEIDTGNLDTSAFNADTLVNVRGFVKPFGQAPSDFVATTIIGMKAMKAVMHTNWRPFSNTAFSRISNEAITLNFTGSGKFHHIGRRHQRLDLTRLATNFTLVPGDFTKGLYILNIGSSKHVHSTFEAFSNDLQDQMNAGALVKRIQAKGLFDSATGDFSAKTVNLHIQ